MYRYAKGLFLLVFLSCVCVSRGQHAPLAQASFCLQDGDTVVFYGDSITEQKLYTSDIENFVLTRFPDRRIRFIQSGVGGDKVSGGWAGPIDLRLARDLIAYRPTMVTIMLGMNDGYYRPFDPAIEETYEAGYRHIVSRILAELPQTSLTLLKPSPFDDATRDPEFGTGYNATMLRFGDFVSRLAKENHTLQADLNQPVVNALTKAKAVNASMSTTLIRDRVHPGSGIHWLMAEAVLNAWGAPAVVTSTAIEALPAKLAAKTNEALNTKITNLVRTKSSLTWTQSDLALPLPLPSAATDPFLGLVQQVSDLNEKLNQERLQVRGMADGVYELQIDDRTVGTFTTGQLAAGINLATLDTPMLEQSRIVAMDTNLLNEIESMRFAFAYDARDPKAIDTVKELDSAIESAIGHRYKDAQPIPHRFALLHATQESGK